MKNILVTGGAGFIGSNFIELYRKYRPDDNIFCIDKLSEASRKDYLEFFKKNKVGFIYDCYSEADLSFIDQIDVVYNFAAESHVDKSIKYPLAFIKNNIECLQIFLDNILMYHPNVLFYHVSTDEVYGDEYVQGGFTEKHALKPNNPYAASKVGSEVLVQSYGHTYGLKYIISRCSNNFGYNQCRNKLIPKVINRLKNGFKANVHGDGSNLRDWIHVKDHCEAIYLLSKQKYIGQIFNVCSGDEISNFDVIKMICEELSLNPAEWMQFIEDRKGNDKRYYINCDKVRAEGWKAKKTLQTEIKKIISHYDK